MDEMSLQEDIHYSERTYNVLVYCGNEYPLGYFFDHIGVNFQNISKIQRIIEVLQAEGLEVLAVTTDAGASFDKMFRKTFAVTESDPVLKLNEKTYLVCKDPLHLVKNAKNYLNKAPIIVPQQILWTCMPNSPFHHQYGHR